MHEIIHGEILRNMLGGNLVRTPATQIFFFFAGEEILQLSLQEILQRLLETIFWESPIESLEKS